MTTPDNLDYIVFRGDLLRQKVLSQLTDGELVRASRRAGARLLVPGTDRVNIFKARDSLTAATLGACRPGDPGVREVLHKWATMAGLPVTEAVFWQEPGFMAAVRDGLDIQLRRYLDDDGWAWLVVRDQSSNWVSKKRLPEGTRRWLQEREARRGGAR